MRYQTSLNLERGITEVGRIKERVTLSKRSWQPEIVSASTVRLEYVIKLRFEFSGVRARVAIDASNATLVFPHLCAHYVH